MIRPEFEATLKSLRTHQQDVGYKPMWVYYQTLEAFPDITYQEVQAIGVELGYKPKWADYKWAEIQESRSQQAEQKNSRSQSRSQSRKSSNQSRQSKQSLEDEFEQWLRAWGYGTYTTSGTNTYTQSNLAPQFLKPHLQILGLDWPTTLQEVKQAYRQLAKKFHPDVGGDADKFIQIDQSYNVVAGYLR